MDDSFWTGFGLELMLLTFIVFFGFAMHHAHVTCQRSNKNTSAKSFVKPLAQ